MSVRVALQIGITECVSEGQRKLQETGVLQGNCLVFVLRTPRFEDCPLIQNFARRSILLSACLFALAVPAMNASAQTTTPTPSTPGTATPQGITGTDPKPILWPPSMKLALGIA